MERIPLQYRASASQRAADAPMMRIKVAAPSGVDFMEMRC